MPNRVLPPGPGSAQLALAGDRVAALHVVVSAHLEDLSRLFRPEMDTKVTFVARAPGYPDGSRDVVVTDDEIGHVIAALKLKAEA